jgi:hypothetical protein
VAAGEAEVTPDECIAAMWAIENARDDGDGVTFRAVADQWWIVTAYCPHVGWTKGVGAASNGQGDLSSAFVEVLAAFREAHA